MLFFNCTLAIMNNRRQNNSKSCIYRLVIVLPVFSGNVPDNTLKHFIRNHILNDSEVCQSMLTYVGSKISPKDFISEYKSRKRIKLGGFFNKVVGPKTYNKFVSYFRICVRQQFAVDFAGMTSQVNPMKRLRKYDMKGLSGEHTTIAGIKLRTNVPGSVYVLSISKHSSKTIFAYEINSRRDFASIFGSEYKLNKKHHAVIHPGNKGEWHTMLTRKFFRKGLQKIHKMNSSEYVQLKKSSKLLHKLEDKFSKLAKDVIPYKVVYKYDTNLSVAENIQMSQEQTQKIIETEYPKVTLDDYECKNMTVELDALPKLTSVVESV